jgi:hypothetical protein
VNPAAPIRLFRSGVAGLTVGHTGDSPVAVTVTVTDGFAADPTRLDLGAGDFAVVVVRWLGASNEAPSASGTGSLDAPGVVGATVELLPFREPVTATPGPPAPPPSADPPLVLRPGPD